MAIDEFDHEHDKRAGDVFKVADLLVSRAIAGHGSEIDIIAYYGSYAQGVASETSDLDIFFVPAEGKDPPVGHTVLVGGLLYDFWGIRWETLEGFATGRTRGWAFAPALVHHAKTLYARSAEQEARFAAVQRSVLDLQSPEARPQMVQRALEAFKTVLAHLGNLRLAAVGEMSDLRFAGWGVIVAACECLALANQTFFHRGWGHLLHEIPRLEHRPTDLEALIVTISTSDSREAIAAGAERLALGTRRVLREAQDALASQREPGQVFEAAYPELKDGLGKVLRACERDQPVSASAAAWSAQSELSLMLNDLCSGTDPAGFNLYSEFATLYSQLGFPDLMGASYADLGEVAERTRSLDGHLRRWLGEQSVSLNEFETLEEFERSLC